METQGGRNAGGPPSRVVASMPRNLLRNFIIITLVALGIAAWSIKNPAKDLRLGRDLRGGARLVYQAILKPGDDANAIIPAMIDVYKKRVDPNGVAEIQIVRQGQDRIEFTMPLPNRESKELKEAFEATLRKLGTSKIDAAQLERVLGLAAGAERTQAIETLAAGSAQRKSIIEAAVAASDEARATRAAYDQAAAASQPQATLDELLTKAGEAADKLEVARKRVLGATLTAGEVRRVLDLSDKPRVILDEAGKGQQTDSPRQAGLKRLREQYPDAKAELDAVLAAFERYGLQRRPLEDPADLKRLLRGAGVLDFRITVKPGEHPEEARLRQELRERGHRNVRATNVRWYKINQLDAWYDSVPEQRAIQMDGSGYFAERGYVVDQYQADGEYYMLAWDVAGNRLTQAEGEWRVDRAFQTFDDIGRPAIGFGMNPAGAGKLADLTGKHVGRQMAVLLDDQVYTAPNLQSQIAASGQISGNFPPEEIQYIIRTLSAGALAARLSPEPISESTLGPELGFDNLQKGLTAGVISLVVIGAFMLIYYFPTCGTIAIISLLLNSLLLLGLMSLNRAAFTMPGIAGIILTFGQAVDSNVLVYERMREELNRGADLRTAVRLGFSRAFNSIVDGNIANLIVCVVLYYLGTQEIKGFAVTMVVGVLTTLFAAIIINRVIFAILVDETRLVRRVSMLPMAVPAIGRALQLKIDWMGLRWVFWGCSLVMVAIGLLVCIVKGTDLLDNDFRGGTQITIPLRAGPDGQQLTRTRQDIQELVIAASDAAPQGSQLELLRQADVLPVNPQSDGVTASQFTIKTLATDKDAVVEALIGKFNAEKLIELLPPLSFKGSDQTEGRSIPAFRVITGNLGDDLLNPRFAGEAREYVGGVAILLEDLQPAESLPSIIGRLDGMRSQPDFADTAVRSHEVRVLEGDATHVRSGVVLVRDPAISFFDNENGWEQDVKVREWSLVREALGKSSTPASVDTFSPTIAASFRAQAIVAALLSFLLLGIYIWIRFGSANFAIAAVVPLVHDVLILIALVALADMLYNTPSTQPIASSLGFLPFKIDLNMVAALLTVVGYSLNDTIIIMDRIREIRGKLPFATRKIINDAVNQTFSRTIITSGTTLFSTAVLYMFGGEGMRGFAFVLTAGVFVGTYSSIAVTAPIVWSRRQEHAAAGADPTVATGV